MRDEALAAHEVRPSSSGARSSVVASEGRQEEPCGHLAAPIRGDQVARRKAARRAETRARSGQLLGRWRLDRVAAAARGPHAFFSVEQIGNSKITELFR